jgi:hypothetical protein
MTPSEALKSIRTLVLRTTEVSWRDWHPLCSATECAVSAS